MKLSALLTSAGINIGVCVLLLSLYSVLRKQPGNVNVYFGRRLAQARRKRNDPFCFDRLVPSPSWIVKAWETTEEEILASSGLDAVVFLRVLVFSIRIFSIAAAVCMFLVLPLNYYGQDMQHKEIPSESLDVFTIGNVEEGSKSFSWQNHRVWVILLAPSNKRLWAHCLALYIISCSACILLYFEYKSISTMRLAHIAASPPNPSHFTVVVRAIPQAPDRSYSDSMKLFFTNYHSSTYLSHQMVYRTGTVQKLMKCTKKLASCGYCEEVTNSFKILSNDPEAKENPFSRIGLSTPEEETTSSAFVFFRSRYAALVASQVLQSSNPMLWVTDLAPEPHDVYWSNLCIPFRQLWIRRIATLLAAMVFVILFLIPVAFVQGLTQLEQVQQRLPFLKGILKKRFMSELVTGYLPSVILLLFLYTVPPTMMLFSAVEGSISRSGRKKSACCKVLYFTIWNIFFVNVLSGSVISQLDVFSSPKDIPAQLARAVPTQASFFMTYVLTSGWAGACSEVVQLFPLLCNLFTKFILRKEEDTSYGTLSFPYHTEVPKVLLFGLLGFTLSILAPLILPLLLLYFSLAFLVYRNQILNVYTSKYESWGQFWPVVHNTTIFSLVLTQIINLGVFGIKKSPVASGFTIPLTICTLLFNEYCRQRFHPVFKHNSAQVLIEMDRVDEEYGRMKDIHEHLQSAYCQFSLAAQYLNVSGVVTVHHGQSGSVSASTSGELEVVKPCLVSEPPPPSPRPPSPRPPSPRPGPLPLLNPPPSLC